MERSTMNAELLRRVGVALYGLHWKYQLGEKLEPRVNARSIRRWDAGEKEIPRNVRNEIRHLIATRIGELTSLLGQLDHSDGQ
jgi:hypothetical protein